MKCPFCGNPDTQVLDTRESEDGDVIRRRRRCAHCEKRCTTFERVELPMPVIVKKNGSRAEYSRDKLRASFTLALRKRPVASEAVEVALAKIEEQMLATALREVGSDQLGAWVMGELRKLDKIAFIRFASVYKNFEDPDEFTNAIQEVLHPQR